MSNTKIRIISFLVACGIFYAGFEVANNTSKNDIDNTSISYLDETSKEEKDIVYEGVVIESEVDRDQEQIKNNELVSATNDTEIHFSNNDNSLTIGNLKINDTAYRIISCNDNWDLVKCNGIIGYVNHDSIEYCSEGEEDIYNHQVLNDIVITTTDLNFRKTPTTEADNRITTLAENTELKVIAQTNNGWYLVSNNGNLGYVSMDYTESMLQKLKAQYPNLELDEIEVQKIVYSTTDLNVRNGASTDSLKIGDMTKYESARVLKEYGDWYLVLTNDYNFGFINKEYTNDLTDTFVVVDKSEQRLFMYNDNELCFTTPVTTGKDTTPSDTGLFAIYSKEKDRYLVGANYRSFVNYWMPYNGGEGLHDASWRSVFGTDSYKTNGSHGCVNLPPEIADDIYENVSIGTKVLVHK